MKKNLVFILCLSLTFTLASCNSDKKVNNSPQNYCRKPKTLQDDSKNNNEKTSH